MLPQNLDQPHGRLGSVKRAYQYTGLPGTCRIPVNTTRPVCCPDAHWDATNGRCCSEPVNSKGLCDAQGVVP